MATDPATTPVATVYIRAADPAILAMWEAVREVAQDLPANGWVLIGGLMVQLHVFRFDGGPARATEDIDVLANSRMRPSGTEQAADALLRAGFAPEQPYGASEPLTVHRFTRENVTVDILGPDGMKGRRGPMATPPHATFPVPGGSQALRREELIEVLLPGHDAFRLRCPSLTGALLLKARAVGRPNREKDLGDLAILLSCIPEPLAIRAELSKQELQWLRAAQGALPSDVQGFQRLAGLGRGERAQQALKLLCPSSTGGSA